jgi:hypothetical protein
VIPPDSFRLKNLTRALTVTEQVRFGAAAPQTLTLAYAEQVVNDDSPRLAGLLDVASRTVSLEYGITLAQQLTLSLRPGYQRFRGAGERDGFASVTLGLARRAARSPWSASLATSYTQVGEGYQVRGDAMLGYRLWSSIQVAAQVRHTRVNGVPEPFNETLGSVRITRRW